MGKNKTMTDEGYVVAFVLMLNDSPISVTLDESVANRKLKKLKKEWEAEKARMSGEDCRGDKHEGTRGMGRAWG